MTIEEVLAASIKEYKRANEMLDICTINNKGFWRGRRMAFFDVVEAIDKEIARDLLIMFPGRLAQ